MTSIADALKFRVLSSKLDNNEFTEFILEFIRRCGRNVLVSSLFNPFIPSSTTENVNHQALQTCIGIIKQIMESRKCKPDTLSQTAITIHSLSPELIGELSSYLCLKDNCAFGVVNRAIYIGCNTPNTLRQLDLTGIDDYSMIRWIRLRKYPHLQHLSIKLSQFQQLQLPTDGTTVCNRLQKFVIDGNKQRDFDIEPFMQQTAINLNNIVRLECKSFGALSHNARAFSCTKFIVILSKFTELKTFVVDLMMLDNSARSYSPQRDSSFEHLTSFKWDGGNIDFFFAILRTHGPQLTRLEFFNSTDERFQRGLVTILTNVSFANLQRIRIRTPTSTIVNQLLKTGTNIQDMELLLKKDTLSQLDTKNMMEQILTQQKSLNRFRVTSKSYRVLSDVCNGIEQGLFATTYCKEALMIDVTYGGGKDIKTLHAKDIVLTIYRITNQLQSSDIQNFGLKFIFKGAHEMHSNQYMIDFMRKSKTNLETYLEWNCVVIKNKVNKQ
eukprot:941987_1